MTPGAAISLQGVGKRYEQEREQAMLLKAILPFRRPARAEHWALRGIELEVGQGETVGVVGHNGAGKTTMLRMLAGVSQPTEGRIEVRGRIAPLIGLGVGFHPEMSGRENVYVNGMLLGLSQRQVEARLEAIVAFAELDEFIDTPVKFYSSGMFMRLGFAVAVHVDPEVLLVDELLAVGDLAFQLRCFDRMRELNDAGTTVLLVSHSMHAIRLLCRRAVLLRAGEIVVDGDIESVIGRHEQLLLDDDRAATGTVDGPQGARILHRALLGPDGPVDQLLPGVPLRLQARVRFDEPVDSPLVHLTVVGEHGAVAYQMRSVLNRPYGSFVAGDEVDLDIAFRSHLTGGPYQPFLTITSVDGRRMLHRDASVPGYDAPAPTDGPGLLDLGLTYRPLPDAPVTG